MTELPEKVYDNDGDEWVRDTENRYRLHGTSGPIILARLRERYGPLSVYDDGQDTPGTQYRDREGDVWFRGFDGRYRQGSDGLGSLSLARLREMYGPLTRIYEPPTDTADADAPSGPQDVRREALALAREWASEDTDNRIGDRPGVAMTYARFLIGEDRS